MLKKIGLGLLFAVCCMTSYTVILRFYGNEPYVLIVPQILFGIAASFEFTIAQCPLQMRGVMVGMCMASIGLVMLSISIYMYNILLDVIMTCFVPVSNTMQLKLV